MAAATKLGYRPNVIARSLITQQTDIVGIVMASLTASHFYPGVLERFTHKLQEMGKQVLLLDAPPGRSVDEMLQRVLGYQVDALIIASLTPGNEMIDVSNRGGRPVILFNRHVADSSASVVCCDNVEGGRLAADFLFDAGHSRIAHVSGPESTTTSVMRRMGFSDQLQRRGYGELIQEEADYTYEAGREVGRRLLAPNSRPDAVFCAADIIALGLMDTARTELGLEIPGDLSVVGFDDIDAAAWPSYDLTTIRQPIDAMISATLELLERKEGESQGSELRLLPVELVIRGSTRIQPG
jgi:DNA-binding LacI/PurR family transcriptional regulator